jgi:hypothetical protein
MKYSATTIKTFSKMIDAKAFAETLRAEGHKNVGWSGQGKTWQVYALQAEEDRTTDD